MILLARRMAKAAFTVGIAIGILMASPLVPYTAATPAPVAMVPDGPCGGSAGPNQGVNDFAHLQCSIHQALFDDGSAPGAAFRFENDISQPGSYAGKSWDGRDIKFVTVTTIDLNFQTNLPDYAAQGMAGRYVIGTLFGPASSIPVAGVLLKPNNHLGCTSKFVLLPMNALSAVECDGFAQDARIQAGVRVLDVNTFRSYSLDTVTGFDSASMSQRIPQQSMRQM